MYTEINNKSKKQRFYGRALSCQLIDYELIRMYCCFKKDGICHGKKITNFYPLSLETTIYVHKASSLTIVC